MSAGGDAALGWFRLPHVGGGQLNHFRLRDVVLVEDSHVWELHRLLSQLQWEEFIPALVTEVSLGFQFFFFFPRHDASPT